MTTLSEQPRQGAPDVARPMRLATVAACLLFAIALSATTLRGLSGAGSPFNSAHAFVSADVATAARTFATEGIWKLRGVPANNNPPIGGRDSYTHWPPLLPLLLSRCFLLFGPSERTAHIFMLCILQVTALLIFRLGWLWLGPLAGALAGYFWLTLPVTVQFGDLVVQESLAVLFVVGAVLAFISSQIELGALLIFFGVFASWEAVLIVPGIWLIDRHLAQRRTAVMATLGAVAGFLCVASLYVTGSPALAADALQTVKFYAGLSPTYSHMLPHDREQLRFAQQIAGLLWNHLWMLGALGLAAAIQLFATRPKNGAFIVSALSAPWLLWTVAMRTHVAVHDFELLIAAPATALALAWLATADLRVFPSRLAVIKTGGICVLSLVQLAVLPALRPTGHADFSSDQLIRYGLEIKNSTQPGSIVMAPLESSVPIFYSGRHIVRGISGDTSLSVALPKIRSEFRDSTIYLAIPPSLAGRFTDALSHATVVRSSEDAMVARLDLR